MPSGLLLEASDKLEVEEELDAVSASADGTGETVLVAALSDDVAASDSELADSEAADSADDMPSVSSEGCHMKAPTYACALQQEWLQLYGREWRMQACTSKKKLRTRLQATQHAPGQSADIACISQFRLSLQHGLRHDV